MTGPGACAGCAGSGEVGTFDETGEIVGVAGCLDCGQTGKASAPPSGPATTGEPPDERCHPLVPPGSCDAACLAAAKAAAATGEPAALEWPADWEPDTGLTNKSIATLLGKALAAPAAHQRADAIIPLRALASLLREVQRARAAGLPRAGRLPVPASNPRAAFAPGPRLSQAEALAFGVLARLARVYAAHNPSTGPALATLAPLLEAK